MQSLQAYQLRPSKMIEVDSDPFKACMDQALALVKRRMDSADDEAHDFRHCLMVASIADSVIKNAVRGEVPDSKSIRFAIRLAALMHDVDDRKVFPDKVLVNMLDQVIPFELYWLKEHIIKMIDLVSCSSNHNIIDNYPKWYYIPRDADRVTAIGYTGIKRAYQVGAKHGSPLYLSSTPKAKSKEELYTIATPERFANYKGNSTSLIDHYYDKLLHLKESSSGIPAMQELFDRSHAVSEEFVLSFGSDKMMTVKEVDDRLHQIKLNASRLYD